MIAAPNPNAFQFKILGRFWPHVDAPRHVELIPLPLLSAQMAYRLCETIWTTTTDKGAIGWNTFGWQYYLTNFGNSWNNIVFKRAMNLAGRIVSTLVSPIERMDALGSAYTAVFRKR